ncbi:hypothetical protein [Nostoc sp.]|uniref:hypothetical protein n=1 Tax=Nostoc sp. TaxID=1180 RepID=UPI002FF99981
MIFSSKLCVLGILRSNSRLEPELDNDMRVYTELWRYVKVTTVEMIENLGLKPRRSTTAFGKIAVVEG